MKVSGRIIDVKDPVEGTTASGRSWKKQNFVIEVWEDNSTSFPRRIAFTHWGERNIENILLNKEVTVYFDLESREFNERWYTDAKSYRIDSGLDNIPSYATQDMNIPNQTSSVNFQTENFAKEATSPIPNFSIADTKLDSDNAFFSDESNDDLPF